MKKITSEQQVSILNSKIQYYQTLGWGIVSKNDSIFSATLQKPNTNKINHPLHIVLTLLLCGVWLIPYIFILLFSNNSNSTMLQKVVTIDIYGNELDKFGRPVVQNINKSSKVLKRTFIDTIFDKAFTVQTPHDKFIPLYIGIGFILMIIIVPVITTKYIAYKTNKLNIYELQKKRELFVADSIYRTTPEYFIKLKNDSIRNVQLKEEKRISDSLLVIKKNKKKQEEIKILKHNINTFKVSELNTSAINELNAAIIMWQLLIESSKEYNITINKSISNKVYRDFRIEYYKVIKAKLWKDDYKIQLIGKNKDILVIAHYSLSLNSNKQETYDTLYPKLKELRFKQLRLKWYMEDSEYTYWDLK